VLLAINIGNTNISLGIFSATKRGGFARLATKNGESAKSFGGNPGEKGAKLKRTFSIPAKKFNLRILKKKLVRANIDNVVICSVVPKLTQVIGQSLKKLTGKTPYIIGKDVIVPIKNRYLKPKQLGQDRLVNAYATPKLYGAPAIIIDAGTAITFDVVSKNNQYLGGLIFPGIGILLASLHEKTALLPLIKITKPKKLIGTNTKSSILSGIVFGVAALSKELVAKIKQHSGKNTLVVGTGGDIGLIKKYLKLKIKIDRNLTLKGINLIYNNKIKNYA